ncbi:LysR substrate-binding domain-containing protein [Granulicella paludicola]|uniref:LysR substrate-binding domain-containing protein n=1 Tax=Granulicella paludicola TaxID=474951 RepID=UPI0021DF752D|nr:LysR substrate-binding domain-containing protein [Granulicella paludicola]
MIENRHLRYFLEVAKTLHITRAAENLHIAQPALTQNIQHLEQELGVQLLERQGRRIALTEAGNVFVEEAERSLNVFEGAQLAAKRAARGEAGEIVIGFQSTAGLSVVPRMLRQLGQRYPEIKVLLNEMGCTAQRNALRKGEIDVAILYTLPDREFVHHELVPESLVMVLPEDHPLASRESIALKEISDEIIILPAIEVAEVLYRSVLAECAEAGFQPRRIQEVSNAQTALGLVSAGFGISILPAAVRYILREGVVIRPIRNSRLQAQLTLMWSPRNPSPIIPKLQDCLG